LFLSYVEFVTMLSPVESAAKNKGKGKEGKEKKGKGKKGG